MVFWFAMQSLAGRSTVQYFTPDCREILHPEPKNVLAVFDPESMPRLARLVTIELTITTMAISDEVTTE
jgi:hypothetical protein